MTLALDTTDDDPRMRISAQLMRHVIAGAGYGVPAAALNDRSLAAWVQLHGVTVTAHDEDELDLLQCSRIRPSQVMFRCGTVTDSIRGP